MFGALGQYAFGEVPAADAQLTQSNDVGLGAIGQYALGEQGLGLGPGVTILVPHTITITTAFGIPIARSGASVKPPSIDVVTAFTAPRVSISATVTIPGTIAIATQFGTLIVRSGASVKPPALLIATQFSNPSIRSGSTIKPPALAITTAFPTPEINARRRRVKSQAILS